MKQSKDRLQQHCARSAACRQHTTDIVTKVEKA
jgi:hypothetical protein